MNFSIENCIFVLTILDTAILFWLLRKISFMDKDIDCMHTTMHMNIDEYVECEHEECEQDLYETIKASTADGLAMIHFKDWDNPDEEEPWTGDAYNPPEDEDFECGRHDGPGAGEEE